MRSRKLEREAAVFLAAVFFAVVFLAVVLAAGTMTLLSGGLDRGGPGSAPRYGSACGRHQLGDLHGVQGRPLAQVVVRDEQYEPTPVGNTRVLPEASDVRRVAAGGLQRRRDLRELDARRRREHLGGPGDGQRTGELGVD